MFLHDKICSVGETKVNKDNFGSHLSFYMGESHHLRELFMNENKGIVLKPLRVSVV